LVSGLVRWAAVVGRARLGQGYEVLWAGADLGAAWPSQPV